MNYSLVWHKQRESKETMKYYENMIGNFLFNDIGQGGFYTGQLFPISSYHSKFSFVYDCGTLSDRDKLNRRIDRFKNLLDNKKLDVLFVSHIDDDHVNGVSELLSDITCDRLYLPYLTPIQRLFVAVRHGVRDTANFDNYLEFLKSPHDYFLNPDNSIINKIVYIKGNSETSVESFNNSDKPISPEDFNSELSDNLEADMDDSEDFSPNVEFRKGNGTLLYSRIWEFYLFHEPVEVIENDSFISKINELFDLEITDSLNKEQLVKILDDKDQLKKLRDLYKEKFKSLNKACLVVQHKPLSYKNARIFKYQKPWYIKHYFNCEYYCKRKKTFFSRPNSNNDFGITLLTGDIGLNQVDNSDYIKSHLDKVIVFQVPHHGSQTGWDNGAKLSLLNHKGKTTSVICFGFGNKYGHPKPKVLEDLEYENFDIKFCNQYEDFSYSFLIKY